MHDSPILVATLETSGLNADRHQGFALAAVVLSPDFKHVLDEFHMRVAFDATRFEWTKDAELVHGFKQDDLKGLPSLEDGGRALHEFIRSRWDSNEAVLLGSHNPQLARAFIVQWLTAAGREVRLHYRSLDSHTLGRCLFFARSSDELFSVLGIDRKNRRDTLDDAHHLARIFQIAAGTRDLPEQDEPKRQRQVSAVVVPWT